MSIVDQAHSMGAKVMHWHPGMQKCDYCDYPSTCRVEAGNGSTAHVCYNHVRCGSGVTDGDHHTYMVHPNAYHAMLMQG